MRALIILLCPLLLVLAFVDVIGSFGQKPAAEGQQEPLPTLHVSIEMNAATGEPSFALTRFDGQTPQPFARLSMRPAEPMQIVLSIEGVEVLSAVVETSNDIPIALPTQDI